MILRPIVKVPGGKRYLAEWIISHFPPGYEQLDYVECCIGGGAVYLRKQPSRSELICDLDPALVDVWLAARDQGPEFHERLAGTAYTEDNFEFSKHLRGTAFETSLARAFHEYVTRRMSRGGLGKDFAWSERLRGGKPGDVNGFETAVAQLPLVTQRLQGTRIECMDASHTIYSHNKPDVLLYCDFPYLHETRVSHDLYAGFEMTVEKHAELLDLLRDFRGKAVVSGYPSAMYDNALSRGWRKVEKSIVNHSSQAKTKQRKIEVLWINHD